MYVCTLCGESQGIFSLLFLVEKNRIFLPCAGDQGKDCLRRCRVHDLREDEPREGDEHGPEDLFELFVPAERFQHRVRVHLHGGADEAGQEDEERQEQDRCADEGKRAGRSCRQTRNCRDREVCREQGRHDRSRRGGSTSGTRRDRCPGICRDLRGIEHADRVEYAPAEGAAGIGEGRSLTGESCIHDAPPLTSPHGWPENPVLPGDLYFTSG